MAKKADPNAWMLTFSDLITLLLTFFVLLLTMSSLDDQDFRPQAGHAGRAFQSLDEVLAPTELIVEHAHRAAS